MKIYNFLLFVYCWEFGLFEVFNDDDYYFEGLSTPKSVINM